MKTKPRKEIYSPKIYASLEKRECSSRSTHGTGDCILLQSQSIHKTHLKADCTHTHPKGGRPDGVVVRRAVLWL